MDEQHKVFTSRSNVWRFPTTKVVFLDKAVRQRASSDHLHDRALYDRALERQRQQAVNRKQNRIEPPRK
jgi:hypothetical protein